MGDSRNVISLSIRFDLTPGIRLKKITVESIPKIVVTYRLPIMSKRTSCPPSCVPGSGLYIISKVMILVMQLISAIPNNIFRSLRNIIENADKYGMVHWQCILFDGNFIMLLQQRLQSEI